MTHAYVDGLHRAVLALAWAAGVATALALVAVLLVLAWLTVDPIYRSAGAAWTRRRVTRSQRDSGRIPGI